MTVKTTFRVIAVTTVALGCVTHAADARTSVRTVPAGSPSLSRAVASPDTSNVAWKLSDALLRVVAPGKPPRTWDMPSGCAAGAVTSDIAVLNCPATGQTLALSLATGAVSRIPVGRLSKDSVTGETFTATSVGRYWVSGSMLLESQLGSRASFPVLVRRDNGQVVDLYGVNDKTALSWGARRYINLSTDRPDRALCRPLTRARASVDVPGRYLPLVKVESWTVRDLRGGSPRLQRCGSSESLRMGYSSALGRGHAAWISANRIHLRRLSTGTTTLYRYRGQRPALDFSSDRLVVTTGTSVTLVALPRS